MRSNFENPLKLKSDGRWLEACGPFDWRSSAGPPASKVIVTVRITSQNGVLGQGTSHECDTSMDEWMIYLRPPPGQKFNPGPALAIGTLTVTEPAPGSTGPGTFSWHESPQLQHA
jgi:hypothetical protein